MQTVIANDRDAAGRPGRAPDSAAAVTEHSGKLLTGPGGPLDRGDAFRELAAFFEGGDFIVNKAQADHSSVRDFEAWAQRQGYTVRPKTLVPYTVISELYAAHRAQSSRTGTIEMQEVLLRIIGKAAERRASDIHIQVTPRLTKVDFTVNGELDEFGEFQSAYGYAMLNAGFAMADVSGANRNPYEPQNARISKLTKPLPRPVEALRMQFVPLVNGGQLLVMRVFYEDDASLGDAQHQLAALGFLPDQQEQLHRMRATPFGMICFTGPTGSGKSTSLRHSLQLLKRERAGANVITIEDPPEGVIMGARQIPIVDATSQTERAGRFHETITASLRLAPNVIYIGEIRDDQSAKLAFEAAMTGHQVWTTLHVTNAMMIPARLRDLGVEDYKLYGSDVLTGLIAQRLVRRLCPECKVPIDEAIFRGSAETAVDTDLALRLDDILGDFAGIFVANRRGCSACDHGYAGRTVIAEIIVPDVEFMKLLRRSLFDDAEQHWRSEMGGMTLYEDAFRKMRLGLIDPTDIEMWFGRLRSPPRVARAPAAATRTTGLAEDRA